MHFLMYLCRWRSCETPSYVQSKVNIRQFVLFSRSLSRSYCPLLPCHHDERVSVRVRA